MIELNDVQERALESSNGIPKLMNEFVTASGVILRTRKVKPPIVMAIIKNIEVPRVPKIFIEELGREEENPNDPFYKDAMDMYLANRASAMTRAYMMFGSDPKFVPDDFQMPDDDWHVELEEAGITVPSVDKKRLRYVAWLEYVVLEDANETAELQKQIMRLSGMTFEEDVKEAEESFPDN